MELCWMLVNFFPDVVLDGFEIHWLEHDIWILWDAKCLWVNWCSKRPRVEAFLEPTKNIIAFHERLPSRYGLAALNFNWRRFFVGHDHIWSWIIWIFLFPILLYVSLTFTFIHLWGLRSKRLIVQRTRAFKWLEGVVGGKEISKNSLLLTSEWNFEDVVVGGWV